MPEPLQIILNGIRTEVRSGTTIAAAMLLAAQPTRVSVSGGVRAALCGMGVCFECRAVVNGVPHQRTCQALCEPGMTVETSR